MTSNSKEDFIKFLDNYKSNPNYYSSISEISLPKGDNGEYDRKRQPLIENSFKMLSLDDICKDCTKFDSNNLPSTTDALWYKLNEDSKLVLYFIEFKWHNLDRKKDQKIMEDTFLKLERGTVITQDMKDKFQKLYKSYSDEDVSFKLRLKPFESLFIVLPSLYEDYCNKNQVEIINLQNFLKNCEIKVLSFVSTYTQPEEEIGESKKGMRIIIDQSRKSKRNKSKHRMNYNRSIGPKGSIGATVRKQYKRLELNSLVDYADIFPRSFFDSFLSDEGLIN